MGAGSGALGSQTDGQLVMRRIVSKDEDGSTKKEWCFESALRDWAPFAYSMEKDGPLYHVTGKVSDSDKAPSSDVKPAPNALPLLIFSRSDLVRAFAGSETATLPSLVRNLGGSDTPNGRVHKLTWLESCVQDETLRENGTCTHKGVVHKLYSINPSKQSEIDLGINSGQSL